MNPILVQTAGGVTPSTWCFPPIEGHLTQEVKPPDQPASGGRQRLTATAGFLDNFTQEDKVVAKDDVFANYLFDLMRLRGTQNHDMRVPREDFFYGPTEVMQQLGGQVLNGASLKLRRDLTNGLVNGIKNTKVRGVVTSMIWVPWQGALGCFGYSLIKEDLNGKLIFAAPVGVLDNLIREVLTSSLSEFNTSMGNGHMPQSSRSTLERLSPSGIEVLKKSIPYKPVQVEENNTLSFGRRG